MKTSNLGKMYGTTSQFFELRTGGTQKTTMPGMAWANKISFKDPWCIKNNH
jgi:hypothetical protein